MHHHPDLVLRIAHDIQRFHIDAAERHRLTRNARALRRPFFAVRERPPQRGSHASWRRSEIVSAAAR